MRNMEGRRAMSLQPLHNEQGVILVIALIFTCVLAIAGTMAYQMTASELLIARNFDSSKGALNAAGTGLEEARAALGLPSTNPPGIAPNAIYDPATSYPDPLWTAYILTSAAWQTSDDTDYNSSDTNYFPTGASFSDQSNTPLLQTVFNRIFHTGSRSGIKWKAGISSITGVRIRLPIQQLPLLPLPPQQSSDPSIS